MLLDGRPVHLVYCRLPVEEERPACQTQGTGMQVKVCEVDSNATQKISPHCGGRAFVKVLGVQLQEAGRAAGTKPAGCNSGSCCFGFAASVCSSCRGIGSADCGRGCPLGCAASGPCHASPPLCHHHGEHGLSRSHCFLGCKKTLQIDCVVFCFCGGLIMHCDSPGRVNHHHASGPLASRYHHYLLVNMWAWSEATMVML